MVELRPLPPAEAIEYFRQKGVAIGFDYRDVWQAEHQAAFTVAKVLQLDILQDIRAEIDRALVEGTTLQDFRKRLTPALQEKGWWGRQVQRDPLTGAEGEVQLGSPRRLKVIYDTNLRTAHSEGQWARIQDNKEAFPYLEYDGNNSEHPRLDHSAWDGLTLPVDHPFWQAHFPVKAYGCKCRARPRTASQVERSGRPVGPAPVVPLVPYVNKRTGEVQQIPAGV
ncbi:phage head morphogenesis protein, partial [Metapseudomonas otitidis]|uniref:phage head morphogenesis protein n=1 Tax=Metapseudomonas otitidis TaxID=319939 RepID=UPI00197E3936